MKPTDFALNLTRYLSIYLPAKAGLSCNTISSYRDMFKLLLAFYEEKLKIKPERLCLINFRREPIEQYLEWLEQERYCSVATRNVRLAALRAFARYLQREAPESLKQWQDILSIPLKKHHQGTFDYLSLEAMRELLNKPNRTSAAGYRDTTLLSLMYDSAARVQEICDLTIGNLRLETPATIKLIGKGNKSRVVPLMDNMAKLLYKYLHEHPAICGKLASHPLFPNRSGMKMTREGVAYLLDKYVGRVRVEGKVNMPEKVTPHCFRHSKAMHMLQAGVNLVYIRDILGHVDIKTTEIYARVDGEMKRKALENNTNLVDKSMPLWQGDKPLLDWLRGFGKRI